MEYLSKQKYDEIAAELKHLINEVYPKVQDELAEAHVPSGVLRLLIESITFDGR